MKYGISLSSYETTFGPIALKQGSLEEKIKIASELHYDGIDLFSHSMNADEVRITSYNVCYTKLLRAGRFTIP